MTITNLNNGLSVSGMPLIGGYMTTGSVFFVDSVTGSNNNSGLDPDHPVSTIDYANDLCTANKGDVIFCMPNHAETLSAAGGITLDTAGVSVIGLGRGTDRPEITLGTTEACDILISGANVTLENMYFDVTALDAVEMALDINASDVKVIGCEFLMADGTGQAELAIDVAAAADNAQIIGNKFVAPDAGGVAAIHMTGGVDKYVVKENWIDGAFTTACIWSSAASIGLAIQDNYMRNTSAGQPCIDIGSTAIASYGSILGNFYDIPDDTAIAAERIAHGKCKDFENYGGADEKVSGLLIPAVEAT